MEFPDLGHHCSKADCGQLDFLPFTCHGCRLVFCLDHRSYQGHNCPQAKRTTTTMCPLCQSPLACGAGDNVDRVVEAHIADGCKPAARKRRKKKRCLVRSCRKVELVPLVCSACSLQFCIGHCLPHNHACNPTQMKIDSTLWPGPNAQTTPPQQSTTPSCSVMQGTPLHPSPATLWEPLPTHSTNLPKSGKPLVTSAPTHSRPQLPQPLQSLQPTYYAMRSGPEEKNSLTRPSPATSTTRRLPTSIPAQSFTTTAATPPTRLHNLPLASKPSTQPSAPAFFMSPRSPVPQRRQPVTAPPLRRRDKSRPRPAS